MYSIQFPQIFSSGKTLLVSDREAIKQNMQLLLLSDRTSLFGDPYYGCVVKQLIYEQNSTILKDIVIDEVYTAIKLFIPQVSVNREDITIKIKNNIVYTIIRCVYLIDGTADLYQLVLMNES